MLPFDLAYKNMSKLQHMGGGGEKNTFEVGIFVPGSPLSPLSPFSPGWASRPSRPSLPGWPGLPCNPGDPGIPGLPVHKLGILLSSSELDQCTAITSSNERGHVCRDVIAQSVEKWTKWKKKLSLIILFQDDFSITQMVWSLHIMWKAVKHMSECCIISPLGQ